MKFDFPWWFKAALAVVLIPTCIAQALWEKVRGS